MYYNYYSIIWNSNSVTKILYLLFVKGMPLSRKLSFYAFVRLPVDGRVRRSKRVAKMNISYS